MIMMIFEDYDDNDDDDDNNDDNNDDDYDNDDIYVYNGGVYVCIVSRKSDPQLHC